MPRRAGRGKGHWAKQSSALSPTFLEALKRRLEPFRIRSVPREEAASLQMAYVLESGEGFGMLTIHHAFGRHSLASRRKSCPFKLRSLHSCTHVVHDPRDSGEPAHDIEAVFIL